MASMAARLSQKRPADVFLNFSTKTAAILLVFFKELSASLASASQENSGVTDAIQSYLQNTPDSALASILDKKEQGRKLKDIAEDFLKAFLEPNSFNCGPVRVFLKQMLSGVALESVLARCSQADWINEWIVYILEGDEPELLNAFDAEVGRVSENGGVDNIPAGHNNATSSTAISDEPNTQGDPMQRLGHTYSSAENPAMDDAEREARRISRLIALDDLGKEASRDDLAFSTNTTESCVTPTSSQSDLPRLSNDDQTTSRPDSAALPLHAPSPASEAEKPFTEFDQILRPTRTSLQVMEPLPLTLLKAKVSILDDGLPNSTQLLKSKPASAEYLLQVEPASTQHPGWIITRRYGQFEELDNIVSRITVIAGVTGFPFKTLPSWRNRDRDSHRYELEAYLCSALTHGPLAECEAMRRFLGKDMAPGKQASAKSGLGFPSPDAFQNIGKGMLGALASAPKGAAGGGKALIDGMSGVFGGAKRAGTLPSKRVPSASPIQAPSAGFSPPSREESAISPSESVDVQVRGASSENRASPKPPLPARRATGETAFAARKEATFTSSHNSLDCAMHESEELGVSPSEARDRTMPPLPTVSDGDHSNVEAVAQQSGSYQRSSQDSQDVKQFESPQGAEAPSSSTPHVDKGLREGQSASTIPRLRPDHPPLTTDETRMAIELIFAVVNELFSLTAIWSVRRTFLNAAKAYVLRPGNLGLDGIRQLLQDSVIETNTSDEGVATHVDRMRESALPTEEELKLWPQPRSAAESERLRLRARELFLTKALPQALTGIMGAASSSDALGKVFDALQTTEVARGLMFSLLLQAARIVIY